MGPLDLREHPPRSCYEELDGLMLMPRTIDKLRAQLPGGHPGGYFINGPMPGISGFLLQRLGIDEAELSEAIAVAGNDDDVAAWLRERVDTATYPELNETLRRIRPKHAGNPALFAEIYAETLAAHPELERIVDVIEADDARMFPGRTRA
jgi:hypothetical protein